MIYASRVDWEWPLHLGQPQEIRPCCGSSRSTPNTSLGHHDSQSQDFTFEKAIIDASSAFGQVRKPQPVTSPQWPGTAHAVLP